MLRSGRTEDRYAPIPVIVVNARLLQSRRAIDLVRVDGALRRAKDRAVARIELYLVGKEAGVLVHLVVSRPSAILAADVLGHLWRFGKDKAGTQAQPW